MAHEFAVTISDEVSFRNIVLQNGESQSPREVGIIHRIQGHEEGSVSWVGFHLFSIPREVSHRREVMSMKQRRKNLYKPADQPVH